MNKDNKQQEEAMQSIVTHTSRVLELDEDEQEILSSAAYLIYSLGMAASAQQNAEYIKEQQRKFLNED